MLLLHSVILLLHSVILLLHSVILLLHSVILLLYGEVYTCTQLLKLSVFIYVLYGLVNCLYILVLNG